VDMQVDESGRDQAATTVGHGSVRIRRAQGIGRSDRHHALHPVGVGCGDQPTVGLEVNMRLVRVRIEPKDCTMPCLHGA